MRTIKVKNYRGNEYNGEWNEKIYSSKIQEYPELLRIYVNNNCIHITPEEYKRITNITSNEYEEKKIQDKIISRREEIKTMSLKEKADLVRYLFLNESTTLSENLVDIIYRLLTVDVNINDFAKTQGISTEKMVTKIMDALFNVFAIVQEETNTKELKVYKDESLDSVVKRLLLYSKEKEEYTAKYNNVILKSKEITKGNAYKIVYGMSHSEWMKQNEKK